MISDVATNGIGQDPVTMALAAEVNPWGQPQTIFAAVSLVIAAFAFFSASAARREIKISRRHEITDKHVEKFRSPMMRAKRDWVETSLADFTKKYGLGPHCGLSAMKVGNPIKLKSSNGDSEVLTGGEIALHVMEHIDDIARDMRHGRLDNQNALQTLGPGLITAWSALAPFMPGRWSPEYYQFTHGRWSIRSLVRIIEPHSTLDARLAAVQDRWGYAEG